MDSAEYYQAHKEVWKTAYYQKQVARLADPEVRADKNRRNKSHMRSRADEKKQRYEKNKLMFLRQLGGKCEQCGFADVRALQFDHVDHTRKTANITVYLRMKDLTKAFNELHFCRLLCANCHAISTHKSGRLRLGRKSGWF